MPGDICELSSDPEKEQATLRVEGDSLGRDEGEAFRAGCRQLLDSGRGKLVVDLRKLHGLLSMHLATILAANEEARSGGRHFRVLARERLCYLFRTVVGPEVLEMSEEEPAD